MPTAALHYSGILRRTAYMRIDSTSSSPCFLYDANCVAQGGGAEEGGTIKQEKDTGLMEKGKKDR